MTKNRYEELSYLNFSDSTKEPARGDVNYNRLFKVRTVIDYVRGKCENNLNPSKNISVDEGMIAFRGRLSCQPNQLSMELRFGWPLILAMVMF